MHAVRITRRSVTSTTSWASCSGHWTQSGCVTTPSSFSWPTTERCSANAVSGTKCPSDRISYVDDKLGQLLGALDTVGLRDDTVVICMADHGEMLGERGLWYKMSFRSDQLRRRQAGPAARGTGHSRAA